MRIPEAIKINTINNDHNPDYTDADREQAHQLGVEALARLTQLRDFLSGLSVVQLLLLPSRIRALLPSETDQ